MKNIQYSTKQEIKKYQNKKLVEAISYLDSKSPFYNKMFKREKIDASKIVSIDDLKLLPVTSKNDLQSNNREFLCVPEEKIIDYVTTSGTLGEPVLFGLTDNDLKRLAYNEKLSFLTAGITSKDILQLMVTLDRRFMAGLAYFEGARALGAGVCRVGNGIPELQWDSIFRIKPTAAVAVPSFLCKLINYAKENNIDVNKSGLKKAICIGEPVRNADFKLNTLGQQICNNWGIQLYSTYASTEMQCSFTECEAQKGGHHQPELLIVELLDKEGNSVKEGEEGEITITSLGVEAMPLLRFRTGDLAYKQSNKCKCGRNTFRISSISGRKGQMIKFKGTTIYPPSLYDIMDNVAGVQNYVVEVFSNNLGTDEILIRIGAQKTDRLEKHIKDVFRAKVRAAPQIIFESSEYINALQFPQNSRKQVKFIDRRKKPRIV